MLEIDLSEEEMADLEAISARTGLPCEEIARAFVCSGMYGRNHQSASVLWDAIANANCGTEI